MTNLESLKSELLRAMEADDAVKMAEATLQCACVVAQSGGEEVTSEWLDQARSHVLSEIARVLVRQGDIAFALEIAWRLPRDERRDGRLENVVLEMAKAQEFDHAISLARDIDGRAHRLGAFRWISRYMVEACQSAAALDMAASIPDDDERSRVESFVAEAQAEFGEFATAIVIANQISSPCLRTVALSRIARNLIKAGQVEAASQTLAPAMNTALDIEDANARAGGLASIAQLQAKLGDFDTALQTTELIREHEGHYSRTLMYVAVCQAESGDREAARATFQAAAEVAQNSEHPFTRAQALSDVVWQMSEAGECALALETAEAGETERDRESGKVTVALTQAKAGDYPAALETLEGISDYGRRSHVFRRIAVKRSRSGETKAAREAFTSAIENAKQIRKDVRRVYSLTSVAREQAKIGDHQGDLFTFGLSIKEAQAMSEEGSRGHAFEAIASALARSGHGNRAVEVVASFAKERNHALPRIGVDLADRSDKDNFKRLLPLCAEHLDAAYQMCGLLAKLYPEQAKAIAEVIIGTPTERN